MDIIFTPLRRTFDRNRLSIYRYFIIAFVILTSVLLVPRVEIGISIPTLLVAVYLGVVGAIVLLRWPALGLFLALVGGVFIPFTGPSGINVAALVIAIMVGVWFLEMMVRQRRIAFVASRTVKPLLLFMVVSVLAFIAGQLPWFTLVGKAPMEAQLGGLAIFLLSAATFLLVAHLIHDLRWLEWMTWIFITLGALYMLGRLLEFSLIDEIFQNGLIAGSMFWTWLAALAFSQAVYNRRLHLFWRLALVGLLIVTLYIAYFINGDWKSGWVPTLVALVAVIAFRNWKPALALAPLAVIAALYLSNQVISTDLYSWSTRLEAWVIVLEITKVNPILGLGFANYYWYTPLIPLRGYASQFNSHSQFVDIIAQTGILGLFCFIWFFWEVGRLGWELRERVPEGFATAYVYGALGGIAGTLVAATLVDWVLPFVYNVGFNGFRASMLPWLFLGGLVSLEQIVRPQANS